MGAAKKVELMEREMFWDLERVYISDQFSSASFRDRDMARRGGLFQGHRIHGTLPTSEEGQGSSCSQ